MSATNGQILTWNNTGTTWEPQTTATPDEISDADKNTKIQVEESANENIIRFDLNGQERWVMQAHRLEPANCGQSVFIGAYAGYSDNLTDNKNIFIGYGCGEKNNSGYCNVASGWRALYSNTTGMGNTAIGYQAMYYNTTASNNTAIGESALKNNSTGFRNTALGNGTLVQNTVGSYNTAIATGALAVNKTGSKNTAIGYFALYTQSYNNGGTVWDSYNTAIGNHALHYNQPTSTTNGYRNSAFGYSALYENTTGADNTSLGYEAGNTNTTGSSNTFLGFQADANSNNLSNSTAIGNGAVVDASNKITLGNSSVSIVQFAGYGAGTLQTDASGNITSSKKMSEYINLIPILIENIEKQQKLIENQAIEINNLKLQIKKLDK